MYSVYHARNTPGEISVSITVIMEITIMTNVNYAADTCPRSYQYKNNSDNPDLK